MMRKAEEKGRRLDKDWKRKEGNGRNEGKSVLGRKVKDEKGRYKMNRRF